MPMKPIPPDSLKGLAGSHPAQARILDDDEVDHLAAQQAEEEADELEDDEEDEE